MNSRDWWEFNAEAADFEARRAFEEWAARRREDGEDASEEAYLEDLESRLQED